MKRFMMMLFTMLMSLAPAQAMGVDAFMDKYIAPVSDAVASLIFIPIKVCGYDVPLIIFWILIAGFFFTIYFKGISIWGFKHAIDIITKPAEKHHDGFGEVSSFQALATALSGTIGIGSIAGVAISISIGGPGAAFWIFAGALLGMSIKFVEATLAVKYRRFNLDGSVSGGPMHYIAHELVFITGGNHSFLEGHTWLVGLVVAILIGMVIVGGIKSIAKVTTILTPTMCILYIVSGLIVIFANFMNIPHAIMLILKEAFHPTAVAGGVFGTIIIGLRRSVQSNEAGTGAAAIVYATAQTKEPVSQGFVALIETFLTGVLCLFTSFAIVFSGACTHAAKEISGIELASNAFQSVIPFFPIILSIIAVMFALSTLISWAYYGQKAWTFLIGEGKKRVLFFNLAYCLFIIIGSAMNVKSVIDITDAMMIALCVPNIIVLYILAPEIKRDLKTYLVKHNMNFMKF